MAGLMNASERVFAPKFVIDRQRDEFLNLSGKYSDGTGPGDQPAAAASATPIKAGQPLSNAPNAPTELAPNLREAAPTIGGNPAASRSDPAFEPRGMIYSPEKAGSTIGGGNNPARSSVSDLFADVRQQKAREELIGEINRNYSDQLQSELSGMDQEQIDERMRREKLFGPSIGFDKDWSEVMPTDKHKSWNTLPSHWPFWKRERAIRVLQGLPEEDENRFLPDKNAGAFDKAMKSTRYDLDSLKKQPSRYGVDK